MSKTPNLSYVDPSGSRRNARFYHNLKLSGAIPSKHARKAIANSRIAESARLFVSALYFIHSSLQKLSTDIRFPDLGTEDKNVKRRDCSVKTSVWRRGSHWGNGNNRIGTQFLYGRLIERTSNKEPRHYYNNICTTPRFFLVNRWNYLYLSLSAAVSWLSRDFFMGCHSTFQSRDNDI